MDDYISRQELKDLIKELRSVIQKKVNEADDKISPRAPEFFVADMKGFMRGLNVAGEEIIGRLEKRLFLN